MCYARDHGHVYAHRGYYHAHDHDHDHVDAHEHDYRHDAYVHALL